MYKKGLISNFLMYKRLKIISNYCHQCKNILDIGCYTADLVNFLNKEKLLNYTGIDISESVIKLNKEKYISENKFYFYNFNVETDDLKLTGLYDCIVLSAVIEHFSSPCKVLAKLSKFLSEKGIIVITTPHPKSKHVIRILAGLGVLSKEANEEHKVLIDKYDMSEMITSLNLRIIEYKKFLFGFNQLFILTKI